MQRQSSVITRKIEGLHESRLESKHTLTQSMYILGIRIARQIGYGTQKELLCWTTLVHILQRFLRSIHVADKIGWWRARGLHL